MESKKQVNYKYSFDLVLQFSLTLDTLQAELQAELQTAPTLNCDSANRSIALFAELPTKSYNNMCNNNSNVLKLTYIRS